MLANTACLSDAQANAIRAFVASGGGVISTFETGMCDEPGSPREKWAPDDLLGVERTGKAAFKAPRAYMQKARERELYENCGDTSLFHLGVRQTGIKAAPGAEVLMLQAEHRVGKPRELIDQPVATSWALAVARTIGGGHSLHFAPELEKACLA